MHAYVYCCDVHYCTVDDMDMLVQASATTSPISSSDDMVTISAHEKPSPHSSTTSLPTTTETPDPPVEEANSPQKTGMFVVVHA